MSETESQVRSVVVERDLPHPPEKVWRALTQPHLIEEWLKMKTDFKPEQGHAFALRGEWGGVDCEVLELDAYTKLAYTWNHEHEDKAFALKSVVTFTLTPTSAGTQLRMEQVGFRSDQKQAYGGARYGWQEHFNNLEKVLAGLD